MPQAAVPVAAAVAGGVASAGVGKLLSDSGGGFPFAPRPGNIRSPGLSITKNRRDYTVERTPELAGNFGLLQSLAQGQAGALGNLLGQVRPGFSALRSSRLTGLENRRRSAIGDLRENLARRRIAGSSFANDALARAELGFQEEADKIRAESFLQELDAYNRILTQQYSTLSAATQAQIQQSNLESTLGANYASGVQTTMANIFNTQAQLAAQSAAGLGQFFAPAVNAVGSAVSGAVQNYFAPPSPSTGSIYYEPSYNVTL